MGEGIGMAIIFLAGLVCFAAALAWLLFLPTVGLLYMMGWFA